MEKVGRVLVLVFCIFSVIFVVVKAEEIDEGNKEWVVDEGPRSPVEEVLVDAVSLLTVTSAAASPPTTNYWRRVRRVIDGVQAYLFPPKIDFREGKDQADGGGKVKEAISKSMETSKETVENSAKSAANIASQTLQNAKEKVKKSLSGDQEREL